MAASNLSNGDNDMHKQPSTVCTEHDELLKQFRANLTDVLDHTHDDYYLSKWLRARKYNLKQAEKMLRDHFAFRETWKVDYIASGWDPPEVLRLYMAGGHFGHDRDGHPVFYQGLGTMDTHGIVRSASRQDILKYTIRICEDIQRSIRDQRQKIGKLIENITLVVDMDNVGVQILYRPFLDIYSEMLRIFEANYPETLHTCFVINAPAIFTTAYSLVKRFLSEDTKSKINVLGRSYKHELLGRISSDQLPVHYGGSATSEDGCPKCGICFGGKIPTSYYYFNTASRDRFLDIVISRGSAIQLTYDIEAAGTVLRWEFLTGKDDVEFSVQYKEKQERKEDSKHSANDCITIISKRRVWSNLVPEKGCVTCERQGKYILEFSNSYSWFRSKRVSYYIYVVPPDESNK